jgi:hypothetical protein
MSVDELADRFAALTGAKTGPYPAPAAESEERSARVSRHDRRIRGVTQSRRAAVSGAKSELTRTEHDRDGNDLTVAPIRLIWHNGCIRDR